MVKQEYLGVMVMMVQLAWLVRMEKEVTLAQLVLLVRLVRLAQRVKKVLMEKPDIQDRKE